MKAIILAGGKGRRLQSVVSNVPKPLAPVRGQPFIFILLRFLISQGVDDIVISTCHLAEQFEEKISLFNKLSPKIKLVKEPANLGTGGASKFVCDEMKIQGSVLVLNGDTFFEFALKSFINKFQNSPALALTEVKDPSRYGTIKLNQGMVESFLEKSPNNATNLIYAGFSIIPSEDILNLLPAGPSSLENDLFPYLAARKQLKAEAYSGKFIDIGIAEDYQFANTEFDFSKYL